MVIDVNVLTTGWIIAGVIASFLVAVVALGLGVSSFIQTKNLQKKERRERLLNEIIEWATDIICLDIDRSYQLDKNLQGEGNLILWVMYGEHRKLEEAYRNLLRKGKLTLHPLISTFRSNSLDNAVSELFDELNMQIVSIEQQVDAILENSNDLSSFISIGEGRMEDKKLLNTTAEKVIEEATKIKTRGIG